MSKPKPTLNQHRSNTKQKQSTTNNTNIKTKQTNCKTEANATPNGNTSEADHTQHRYDSLTKPNTFQKQSTNKFNIIQTPN